MEVNGITLLLVEDDDVDAEAIQRAFRQQRIANPFVLARDGVEALAMMRDPAALKYPYVVLLDINLPRMNGLELLEAVRDDPALARTIVFVLTTSDRDEDKVAAYDHHVAGYILKSRAGADFLRGRPDAEGLLAPRRVPAGHGPARHGPAGPAAAMTPEPLCVLLVDDDDVDRALVRRVLDPAHDVCEAATAAEGRECLETGFDGAGPDVVLLDLRLPDADGTDLLPVYGARGVPVVMLTGVDDTAVAVETMQAGALDYLVKGALTAPLLERALRRAVETAGLRRAVAEQQAEIAAQRDRLAEQADALARTNREVRDLARALTLAEQAERHRLSALLHDDMQQLLFGAQILLASAQRDAGAEPLRARLARASAIVGEGIEAARRLALDLTPPVLESDDYALTLRWLAGHAGETYGLTVDVDIAEGADTRGAGLGDREVRVLVTAVVRELLFNVAKHAGTDRATVRLRRHGATAEVEVSDAGGGFDPTASGGFGLYSVRRRLELLGGTLTVDSARGEGSRVTLRFPTSNAA